MDIYIVTENDFYESNEKVVGAYDNLQSAIEAANNAVPDENGLRELKYSSVWQGAIGSTDFKEVYGTHFKK